MWGFRHSLPRLTAFVIYAAVASVHGSPAHAGDLDRLEFRSEVQNLRVIQDTLRPTAPSSLESVCKNLDGEVRFGSIPHRRYDENISSTGNFVKFAVSYSDDTAPAVLLDFDRDHRIACDEVMPMIPHPRDSGLLLRTVLLEWNRDKGPRRKQRYRLTVAADPQDGRYFIDLIDVPVARRVLDGVSTLWILYDGNHNGVFDRKFGDGLLIDTTGTALIDVSPRGDNFHSYHHPLRLPSGTFQLTALDPEGGFLSLVQIAADAVDERPFVLGDPVPSLRCRSDGDESITIAGPSSQYQLLFFWLSSCGSCWADMKALVPHLETLGSSRLTAVGISLDESVDEFRDFVESTGVEWPQCFSGRMLWDNAIGRRFGVSIPSDYVIIDPEGRLFRRGNGFDELKLTIAELFPRPES